jgi:putative ATPase
LGKQLGYGKEYRYAHDEAEGFAAGENYFPQSLQHAQFYFPKNSGLEKRIKEKLDYFRQLNAESDNKRYDNEEDSEGPG